MESSLDKNCSSLGISPTTQHKKYPPSELIRERLLSTTERLALPCTTKVEIISFDNIVDQPPNQRDFRVPLDEPLFKPLPTQIHLQNFKPFQTYDVLISFRNMDKVGFNLWKYIYSPLSSLRERSKLNQSIVIPFRFVDGVPSR